MSEEKSKPEMITASGPIWRFLQLEAKHSEEIRKLCSGSYYETKKPKLTRRENIMRLRQKK